MSVRRNRGSDKDKEEERALGSLRFRFSECTLTAASSEAVRVRRKERGFHFKRTANYKD
jgi:hypothetical protein